MKPSEMQFSNNLIALCSPQSRRIVSALARKDMSAESLAKFCKLSLGSISKHCAVLIHANLVLIRSVGVDTFYSLNREALEETRDWFVALP